MKTVLIIEDEEVIAKIYQKHLNNNNFKAHIAHNANKALRLAKETQPTAILLDHGLKDINTTGLELIPKLKEITQNSIIIMLSNFNKKELIEEAENYGADHFLVKINTPPKILPQKLNKILTPST